MDLNNRMVCYNISKLGQGLKKLVMSNVQKTYLAAHSGQPLRRYHHPDFLG